ncbi:S9 family peptidase [Nonomuraea rhodomycinica]|uniref:S9 family peptidase n=1 Tax=Nonomuraea rhodomycinica TaxID=1712872 RepID=A0A7Y6MF85_9ACTN|nr:S9 family peptidase [Nonomuraea rhodomycinica]
MLADLPGSTDYGILSPDGETAYLLSDAGRDRPALLAVRRVTGSAGTAARRVEGSAGTAVRGVEGFSGAAARRVEGFSGTAARRPGVTPPDGRHRPAWPGLPGGGPQSYGAAAGREHAVAAERGEAVPTGLEHGVPTGSEHGVPGGRRHGVAAGPEPDGREHVVLAGRDDAELDQFALTPDGRWAVLVWNEHGRSALAVLDTGTGAVTPLPPLPADVVTSIRMSLDGATAVMAAESPDQPSHVLLCDLATGRYEEVAGLGRLAHAPRAELIEFTAHDGLDLAAWLYRPPAVQGPAPYLVYLHGGPEDQERPTFNPLYHNLLAAGIGVLAPNVRGSSGHGRAFREADDRELRFHAIEDVADCAAELVRLGLADPGRLACMGWSYGGYLTLAALVAHPRLFRTGIDVCGMSDFESFYARTEPWIAAAAVGEYGHPEQDRDLLRALSPLRRFDRLEAPLLVVHGVHDTNVPVHEAEQAVRAARARGVVCEELLFPDEGHEIRRPANRAVFVGRVVDWLTHHLVAPHH